MSFIRGYSFNIPQTFPLRFNVKTKEILNIKQLPGKRLPTNNIFSIFTVVLPSRLPKPNELIIPDNTYGKESNIISWDNDNMVQPPNKKKKIQLLSDYSVNATIKELKDYDKHLTVINDKIERKSEDFGTQSMDEYAMDTVQVENPIFLSNKEKAIKEIDNIRPGASLKYNLLERKLVDDEDPPGESLDVTLTNLKSILTDKDIPHDEKEKQYTNVVYAIEKYLDESASTVYSTVNESQV